MILGGGGGDVSKIAYEHEKTVMGCQLLCE